MFPLQELHDLYFLSMASTATSMSGGVSTENLFGKKTIFITLRFDIILVFLRRFTGFVWSQVCRIYVGTLVNVSNIATDILVWVSSPLLPDFNSSSLSLITSSRVSSPAKSCAAGMGHLKHNQIWYSINSPLSIGIEETVLSSTSSWSSDSANCSESGSENT